MPQDRNGKQVKLGNIVRGRGYNTKHEIIGEVVGLVEGADQCNITVASCQVRPALFGAFGYLGPNGKIVVPGIEYGAASDFEVIAESAQG